MDWLGGWLKAIIMVIMLATFVDLLLPSSKMQRYVKTVVSLFVLLTLLSPVMQLFQTNWNVDKLISAAEQKQQIAESGTGTSPVKTLEEITQEAHRLQADNDKQAKYMIQTQLAEVMKEDLQKQTDLKVDDVQVVVNMDNNGKPVLTDVRVTLHDIEAGRTQTSGSTNTKSIAVMEPVKPIDPIRIGTQSEDSAANGQPESEGSGLPPRLEKERDRLVQGIARDWQVEPSHIRISMESDQSKSKRL